MDELAENCRQKGIGDMGGVEQSLIENLVSFVSWNPDVAQIVISTIRPKHVLLFYTKESKDLFLELEGELEKSGIEVFGELYKDRNVEEEDSNVYYAIQNFLKKYGTEKTAFDMTPGPKDFMMVASWSLNPKISPFLYLCHNFKRPGNEKIRHLHPHFLSENSA